MAGFLFFLVGAAFWKPAVYQRELSLALPAMAEDQGRLRWIFRWMWVGVTVTTLGIALLTSALWGQGEKVWSILGLASFSLGAVLWLAALAFRLTVGISAALQTRKTGDVPPGFEVWDKWPAPFIRFIC